MIYQLWEEKNYALTMISERHSTISNRAKIDYSTKTWARAKLNLIGQVYNKHGVKQSFQNLN